MKKIVLLTFFVMIFIILTLGVVNVSAETYGVLTYTILNDQITITDCSASATNVEIPGNISGYPVTSIGSQAFKDCRNLITVKIPDSVEIIEYEAFKTCNQLESVSLGNGIKEIDQYAFMACISLESIIIPDSVTTIGNGAFYMCAYLEDVIIGRNVTNIDKNAFYYCENLISIRIPSKVTDIGDYAFYGCDSLETVYYNGNKNTFGNINIGRNNTNLTKAQMNYFYYVKIIDENSNVISEKMNSANTQADVRDITPKFEHTIHFYLDQNHLTEFDITTLINQDITLYLKNVPNKYTYKFVDADGTLLQEKTVDYDTLIVPPTVPPDNDPYTFDYWDGYTEGMTIGENITFTAVYKYKNYLITVDGLETPINVTYNNTFLIPPQSIDSYHQFTGYFTEKDGKGTQITNEKGESLSLYDVVGNIIVYPYFYKTYRNIIEMQGTVSAMPGDLISQQVIFATDYDVKYFKIKIKYPKFLNLTKIEKVDFVEVDKESETEDDNYKYLTVNCLYDYANNFLPTNTNLIPFKLDFTLSTNAPIGVFSINIEDAMFVDNTNFKFEDITNNNVEILPKLSERVTIEGNYFISLPTKFVANVYPDYVTNKSVVWSVDKENVATISQDGVLTPIINGNVVITATAKDGSEVFGTKNVQVIAYAKIDTIDFSEGMLATAFHPNNRNYTVYVNEDATSIALTPTFSNGVVRPNGSGVWFSGIPKTFELNEQETTITLNIENVANMTNNIYTIKVIKLNTTRTQVSSDGKAFDITINPMLLGKRIIIALYNGKQFVEMQSKEITADKAEFTTTESYTNAKVMVWDNFTNLKPACDVEIVK